MSYPATTTASRPARTTDLRTLDAAYTRVLENAIEARNALDGAYGSVRGILRQVVDAARSASRAIDQGRLLTPDVIAERIVEANATADSLAKMANDFAGSGMAIGFAVAMG